MVACKFPINPDHKCLEAPIDVLGLLEPEYNALRRGKVETVKQLVDEWYKIREIRNLGITREEKIKKAFRNYYYVNLDPTEVKRFDKRFAELNGGLSWKPVA